MPKVNREQLFEFRWSIPSVQKQKELALNLDAPHEEIQALTALYRRKRIALEDLKKSLLQRAFAGQL